MRAAAGADLDQLHRGDLDRQAGAAQEALLPRRLEAPADQRLAAIDQGQLGGGAAHVEGQHPVEPGVAAEPGAGQRARPPGRFPAAAPAPAWPPPHGSGRRSTASGTARRGCPPRAAPSPAAPGRSPPAAAHRHWRRWCWRAGIRGSRARSSEESETESRGKRCATAAADRPLMRRIGVGVQEAPRRGSRCPAATSAATSASAASRSSGISTAAVGRQPFRAPRAARAAAPAASASR